MIDTNNPTPAPLPTIEQEIAALRAMSTSDLIAKYVEVFGRDPKRKSREWLWKRLAWRSQEKRLGGLSKVAKDRLEELIGQIELPATEQKRTVTGSLTKKRNSRGAKVGETLTREYKGQSVVVVSSKNGFEWNGATYRSLSAIAFAVTGAHWNGKLFFGLTRRGKARRRS